MYVVFFYRILYGSYQNVFTTTTVTTKHTKINENPVNSFLLVLFLLKDEHVVVEELLQTLVGVVDTQLLEGVELAISYSSIDEYI